MINHPNKPEPATISNSLPENIETFKALFHEDRDFVVREFDIIITNRRRAALFFVDGLVDIAAINESILKPLMLESRKLDNHNSIVFESISDISNAFLISGEVKSSAIIDDVIISCLMGDAVLMVDDFSEFIIINTKGFEKRAVTEPQTETVVRGPREGFTEVLRINTSLIRRRLKTPNLRMEMLEIGERTRTSVCLAYIDNIANPDLVAEVRKRLKTIDTDAILNSGYIEEYIEDAPLSLFQTIYYSEKPDIVAAKLLEGRCAVIIDGTPFVLTMPMLFIECFQSPEDFAMRPFMAIFLRAVRVFSFFLTLVAPSMYIALTSFHQELIPTALLFTIAASSEGIPFNSVVETAIMLLTFEILKEAGVRLPKPIGQAVSIVGALVMGQAAIQAGIVGAPVVIVIAFTAVAGFLVPNASESISLLRWLLLILSGLMGAYGIVLGLIAIFIHLSSIESFGSAYLYPFSPFNWTDMKDGIIRMPLWKMRTRPAILRPQDETRQNMSKPEFGQGKNGSNTDSGRV